MKNIIPTGQIFQGFVLHELRMFLTVTLRASKLLNNCQAKQSFRCSQSRSMGLSSGQWAGWNRRIMFSGTFSLGVVWNDPLSNWMICKSSGYAPENHLEIPESTQCLSEKFRGKSCLHFQVPRHHTHNIFSRLNWRLPTGLTPWMSTSLKSSQSQPVSSSHQYRLLNFFWLFLPP